MAYRAIEDLEVHRPSNVDLRLPSVNEDGEQSLQRTAKTVDGRCHQGGWLQILVSCNVLNHRGNNL